MEKITTYKREKPIIVKNINTGDVFSFKSMSNAC